MAGTRRIIFWDWTGTLADESALDRAVCEHMERELARERGIPRREAAEEFQRHLEKLEGTWQWHDYILHGQALGLDWKQSQIESMARLRLIDGAVEILDFARGLGYLNILATNAVEPVVRLRAASAGIKSRFDAVIGSDRAGALKSEGRHFRIGLEDFEADPALSFSVGDNPVQDIRPARRLGMTTVFFEAGRHRTHYHSAHISNNHQENDRPDFRIRTLGELQEILQ
jgi:FMN phosphatase YigB (HAD superfamily)